MEIPGYQIDKQIGRGGMAKVYLATQVSLSRHVVLKIMELSEEPDDNVRVNRFLAEGRIVASMNHPNIITIYDIGLADGNLLYISMEYIQGGDLKSRLGVVMHPKEALWIILQISHGLLAAHSRGIIHRDVKPANILFRDEATPLLSDFGIAKQLDSDLDLTKTSAFLGSPNYISPEQAEGSEVDERSDIYSLGCVFYEMITAQKPYTGKNVFDVIKQHQTAPVPVLPDSLKEYRDLLERMMAKDRNKRFKSVSDLIKAISLLQDKKKSPISLFGLDVAERSNGSRLKKRYLVLFPLLFVSLVFFAALQYVDYRLKYAGDIDLGDIPIATTLDSDDKTATAAATAKQEADSVSTDVVNALIWLGQNSLQSYKLTYPEEDNAYYYFSRLLEIDPDNAIAIKGIQEVANRYLILAEKAFAAQEYDKADAYIRIGLKIDPDNRSLLTLKGINASQQEKGVWAKIKSIF